MDQFSEEALLYRWLYWQGANKEGLIGFASALRSAPAEGTEVGLYEVDGRSRSARQQLATAIMRETSLLAVPGEVVPVYGDVVAGAYKPVPQIPVGGPPPRYARTRDLPGYDKAVASVHRALHREWALTRAAKAGHRSRAPWFDALFHKIRAGQIKRGDPRIEEAIRLAAQTGYGDIAERIGEEFHNADKRRERGGQDCLLYDINLFRVRLASLWVHCLLWLMPDRLIAEFLIRKGVVPGMKCTRQTVNRAVKEMRLFRHKPLLVKEFVNSTDQNFLIVFHDAYAYLDVTAASLPPP